MSHRIAYWVWTHGQYGSLVHRFIELIACRSLFSISLLCVFRFVCFRILFEVFLAHNATDDGDTPKFRHNLLTWIKMQFFQPLGNDIDRVTRARSQFYRRWRWIIQFVVQFFVSSVRQFFCCSYYFLHAFVFAFCFGAHRTLGDFTHFFASVLSVKSIETQRKEHSVRKCVWERDGNDGFRQSEFGWFVSF